MPGRNFIFPATITRPTWQAGAREEHAIHRARAAEARTIALPVLLDGRVVRSLANSRLVFWNTRRASSRPSYTVVSAAESGSNERGFSNANPYGSGDRRSPGGRATPST